MGWLDEIMGEGGGLSGIANVIAQNPQVLAAVASLLSSRDATVGGAGGLGSLVQAFQQQGLGDVLASWLSTGQNQGISAEALAGVLGNGTLEQFASKAGIDLSQAGPVLAQLLPVVIDRLTPDGSLPQPDQLENALGGLVQGWLRA